ncbi:MAG: SGNH/GDSL hydrolase family protein [Geminicoccaceae bacterium]
MPTILCFGDSNTHGTLPLTGPGDIRRLGPTRRWPGVLAAELGPDYRVIEEGLPGRTTVHADPIEGAHMNGLAALPMLLASHSPIDLMTIKLGTNDLKVRHSVCAADIARSIELLVLTTRQLCTAPGRIVPNFLIIAPPPIEEAGCLAEIFAGGRAKSLEVGPWLRRSAEFLGTGFLDAGDHIEVSPIDGIHYDEAAHATLGRAIAAAVRAL